MTPLNPSSLSPASLGAGGLRGLAWLRRRIRSSELWLIAVATLVGAVAGSLAVLQGRIAHGLQLLLFGFDPDERLSAQAMIAPHQALFIPRTDWILQPILAVIPLQLLAYHTARQLGLNVDQPRNLAKTVTVE